jgi:hypothetical protein
MFTNGFQGISLGVVHELWKFMDTFFLWYFFLIRVVGLWVLRPLLAYCTSPGR